MFCSNCGQNIPEGAVFCSNCGARCVRKVCSACGAELKEGQLFCHVCGLKYGEEASQDIQESSSSEPGKEEQPSVGAAATQGKAVMAKKVFNIICRAAYVGMAIVLMYCVCGNVDHWSYSTKNIYTGKWTHHYEYWSEMPTFWLTAFLVIAGSIYEVYYIRKINDGRNKTRGNKVVWLVRLVLLILSVIFFLVFGEEMFF